MHRGALASLHREQRHSIEQLLAQQRLVVLEDIVDHTNVGAILRNAAGLGWDGALLSPRAADPLYRRSIKVSMGAVFSLPWARLVDWRNAPHLLSAAGFLTVALSLAPDAVELSELAATITSQSRIAVLLGTEGAGLSTRWSDGAAVTGPYSHVCGHRFTQCGSRGCNRLLRAVGAGSDWPVLGIEVGCILM